MRNNRDNQNPSVLKRLLRSFVSVTVLSCLVLSISLLVKQMSSVDSSIALKISEPLLDKLGIDSSKLGTVAGDTSVRSSHGQEEESTEDLKVPHAETKETPVFSMAFFADSHNDSSNLQKALYLAKESEVDFIVHVGDWTDLGVQEDLAEAKAFMDASGLQYYGLPGDRDLWQSVGTKNFLNVFGEDFYSFTHKGISFVLLNNSAIFTPLPDELVQEFYQEIQGADVVVLSQPLYHPSKNKVMGYDNEGNEVSAVKLQADELLAKIRDSSIKAIFAGEHHVSSSTIDPQNPDLRHYVIGAITSTINNRPQKLLQTPRFSILKVYEDSTLEVEEVVLP